MASPTPALKALIGVVVVSGLVAVGWHLGYKPYAAKRAAADAGRPAVTASAGPAASTGSVASTGAPAKSSNGFSMPSLGGSALGSDSNPLKVSIVSFHGYAPALVANGNSLTTKAGSLFAKEGLNVKFLLQDDIPTLSDLFEKNIAQCAWRTSDFWAQEQPNLRNNNMDGAAVMIVDNTQGGDAIITRDPSVNSVEDLAGKRVAMLQFTPSHGMTYDAIASSSLSARKKESVKYVFIDAAEGTSGVRAAFEAGNVEAAALWDPDLSLALRVPGSKVVYSTKTATNLIYDVMVCNQKVLKTPEGAAAVGKFVAGWMAGVEAAKANPDGAVDALIQTQEFFKLLAQKEGKPFIKSLFTNIVWTGVADNARILGLTGGTNHYERVYTQFDQIYRAAGALANPRSPVIRASESFDYRFINALVKQNATAAAPAAATPAPAFTPSGLTEAVKEDKKAVTKAVQVTFPSGSAELSKRGKELIDREMVPMVDNNGSAYFELSGNTDSVGSDSGNKPLSVARAKAVRDYLVRNWEYSPSRFNVVGNGSSKPLCDERNPGADGLDLEQCRALNRTTRISVFQR